MKIWHSLQSLLRNHLSKGGILTILLCSVIYSQGQNLVPNPSFESNTGMPIFLSEWPLVLDWDNAGGITTPDFFHNNAPNTGAASLPNNLFATISPNSGDGIMGFYSYMVTSGTDYREYLQTQLINPLTTGKTYEVSFWVSNGLPTTAGFGGSDGLGVHFSDFPISQSNTSPSYQGPINVIPNFEITSIFWDSLWQELRFTFIPTSPVEYLTVGNFKDNTSTNLNASSSTSYLFVDDFLVVPIMTIVGNDSLCEGDSMLLEASLASSYVWKDVQNPNVILGTSSQLSLFPTNSGAIYVIGDGDTAWHDYTVISSKNLDLGPDILLCQGDEITLQANQIGAVTYLWNTGDNSPQITIDTSGLFTLEIHYEGCTEKDSILITGINKPIVDLGIDTTLCDGQSISFNFSNYQTQYNWMDGDFANIKTISQEGLIWVNASNICGTVGDSMNLRIIPGPELDLGPDQVVCDENSLLIDLSGQSGDSFLWNNGSTNSSISINQTGLYWVNVSSECGITSDTIEVTMVESPVMDLGEDAKFCEGESLTLNLSLSSVDYLWDNGQTNAEREIFQTGTYWVIAANECGNDSDSIEIEMIDLPVVDLGNDTSFCAGEPILLDAAQALDADYQWSNGTSEPFVVINEPGILEVTVSNECGETNDQIQIKSSSPPEIFLGNDTMLCSDLGAKLFIDITQPNSEYLWNDQSNSPIKEISAAGYYEVTIANECGMAMDAIEVGEEVCDCKFYFPNAFSPNDDGKNDRFGPGYSCNVEFYSMKIFDRWGKKMFSTTLPDHK